MKPIEWINCARRTLSHKIENGGAKTDTLRGCIKLLDSRGVFDQYF